jgi:enamine deaminase RidA (YjgF/YER057c/UK114 family)
MSDPTRGIPVQPPGWPRARGFANGMRARGELLAVAGQVGWDAEQRVVPGGLGPQFEQALANVLAVVRTAGGVPEHVISLTIYVTDKAAYLAEQADLGARYRLLLGSHYPATALVEVAGLLEPEALVEIQALAVLP